MVSSIRSLVVPEDGVRPAYMAADLRAEDGIQGAGLGVCRRKYLPPSGLR